MREEDILDKILEIIEDMGLNPNEVSKRCGMTHSTLYNMKNRGTVPKIGTLMKILDGLDIPICDFFVADTRPKKDGYLTVEEMDLVEVNRTLNKRNREQLLMFALALRDGQKNNKR